MKLSDRALLVQLSISTWSGNKLDKGLSAETTKAKGAVSGSARVHKTLLPKCDLLDNIKEKATLIRTKFYTNTLPWGVKGTQILPSANFLAFTADFRKERDEYNVLVNRFLPHYPQLVRDARQNLGQAYRPDDYPDPRDIANKFSVDLQFMPVPTNDFRVDIASDELARIHQEVEARVQQATRDAMRDVWQRLYERVAHFAERLSDPTAVFRDTTVTHLVELCELLPRLNVTEDPTLEAMRQEVERKLAAYHPDDLRSNPDVRQDTARDASDIARRMAAFMDTM